MFLLLLLSTDLHLGNDEQGDEDGDDDEEDDDVDEVRREFLCCLISTCPVLPVQSACELLSLLPPHCPTTSVQYQVSSQYQTSKQSVA